MRPKFGASVKRKDDALADGRNILLGKVDEGGDIAQIGLFGTVLGDSATVFFVGCCRVGHLSGARPLTP